MTGQVNDRKQCFVLGAGFSAPCKLPLSRDLTRDVWQYAFQNADAGILQKAGEKARKGIQFLYPGSDCDTAWPDFEQLLTFLDEYLAYGRDYVHAGGVETHAHVWEQLRESLIRNLCLLLAERSGDAPASAKTLFKDFVRRALEVRGSLISFNWDCLVEIACAELQLPVLYKGDRAGRLSLTKPHGSVNLVELPTVRLDELQTAQNIHGLTELAKGNERSVLCAENPLDVVNRTLSPFGVNDWLIVPPGARKSFDSFWIKQQWKQALDSLRSAETITLLGYSLPEYDTRYRLLFRLAIVGKSEAKNPLIRVVDLNPAPIAARIHACGYLRVECIAKPWEDWFRGS